MFPKDIFAFKSREIGSFLLPILKESDAHGYVQRLVQIQRQVHGQHVWIEVCTKDQVLDELKDLYVAQ